MKFIVLMLVALIFASPEMASSETNPTSAKFEQMKTDEQKLKFAVDILSSGAVKKGTSKEDLVKMFGNSLIAVGGTTPDGLTIVGVLLYSLGAAPPSARQAAITGWYLEFHLNSQGRVAFYFLTNCPAK